MRDILARLTALGVRADDLLEIAEAFKARERLLARCQGERSRQHKSRHVTSRDK